MGNGINKVLPDLYLGNFKDARDREQLARHNITHILSIHDNAAPLLQEMTYLCISAADLPTQNLTQHFKASISFIHESRLKGEGCLVHCTYSEEYLENFHPLKFIRENGIICNLEVDPHTPSRVQKVHYSLAGVSRSVTLVVAYIMTVTELGWQDALAAVRAVRSSANPNLGFQRQLADFERTQAANYRTWFKERYKQNPFSDEEAICLLLSKDTKSNSTEETTPDIRNS